LHHQHHYYYDDDEAASAALQMVAMTIAASTDTTRLQYIKWNSQDRIDADAVGKRALIVLSFDRRSE